MTRNKKTNILRYAEQQTYSKALLIEHESAEIATQTQYLDMKGGKHSLEGSLLVLDYAEIHRSAPHGSDGF